MEKVVKIAIIGPESTGKSTISEQLAAHYATNWVTEYARAYCSKLTEPCTLQDELNMFKGQILVEDAALAQKPALLFCDTTILNVKIWCEHVFEECPAQVVEEIKRRPYDLYLLMDIDMPWQYDPLREFPDLRDHFLAIFKLELQQLKANYVVISGIGDARLQAAITTIDSFLA